MSAFIFYTSGVPGPQVRALGFGKETTHEQVHFLLYFLLCFAFYIPTKSIKKSIFLSFLYSITDEAHQMFVPQRTAELFDIFMDTVGASCAGILIWKFYRTLSKRPNKSQLK